MSQNEPLKYITHKINQFSAAVMVYSFTSYSDFIHEFTVQAADCSGRSKAVRIVLNLYT